MSDSLVAQLMPCGALVNCSDSHMSRLPAWAMSTPLDGLSMAALASGSVDAMSVVRTLFPEVPASFAGMRLAAACPSPSSRDADVQPWAFFPSQQLVTWRERFRRPTDTQPEVGVWVKGGSPLCRSHGHRDQGHVSVYRGCEPLLLDCGTPDYSDPLYEASYASAAGHNVLQIDPVRPHGQAVDAPVSVARLDASGGLVSIDLAKGYPATTRYIRTVEWSAQLVRVQDSIDFHADVPAKTELLRYHIGAREPPRVEHALGAWMVSWSGAALKVTSGANLAVSIRQWPDRTTAEGVHHVVVIELLESRREASIVTELDVGSSAGNH